MVSLGCTVGCQVQGGTLFPASAFFQTAGLPSFTRGKEYLALLKMGCCCTFTAVMFCQTSTCVFVWSLLY